MVTIFSLCSFVIMMTSYHLEKIKVILPPKWRNGGPSLKLGYPNEYTSPLSKKHVSIFLCSVCGKQNSIEKYHLETFKDEIEIFHCDDRVR